MAVLIAAMLSIVLGPPALARGGSHGASIRSSASLSSRAPAAISAASPSASSGSIASNGASGGTTNSRGGGGGGGSATPPQTAPTAAPASQIAVPMPQQPAIAPLSPQLPAQVATATSTPSNAGGSPSPSETAPSAPGGGGQGVQACMRFWDARTHMSKAEWRAACTRIETRLANLKESNLSLGQGSGRAGPRKSTVSQGSAVAIARFGP